MSTNEPAWRTELESLCELACDGQLTGSSRDRLEELAASDPDAAEFCAEYLHQHALLRKIASESGLLNVSPQRLPVSARDRIERNPSNRRWLRIGVSILSSAAALLIGLWFGGKLTTKAAPPEIVATLTSTKACKWAGATVPTEAGAQLTAGRLDLAEGVARLTFASGAEISLEGPAKLELVSRDKCVLTSGRLVASVPKHAIGFLVVTEAAVLKDLGTEFGVNVRGPDSVDVAVFDGLVDVQERTSGHVSQIREGNTARVQDKQVVVFASTEEPPPPTPATGPTTAAIDSSKRLIKITDAMGRGKEAFILSSGAPDVEHMNPAVLQVKNVTKSDSLFHRKLYATFDLISLGDEPVLDAQVEFSLIPTPFSSRFPDTTFAVYGIARESLDNWDEQTLRWDNAPANGPGGAGLDMKNVMLLGRFVVEQGIQEGVFHVGGEPLRRLLKIDRNRLLTVILVRETADPDEVGIIHGFASRRHPTASPPTLKLTVRSSGGAN
jgi:ferric-dicitrate binding protein FerR (iron transport regulator)